MMQPTPLIILTIRTGENRGRSLAIIRTIRTGGKGNNL